MKTTTLIAGVCGLLGVASCSTEAPPAVSTAVSLTVCPSTNVIGDPPEFQWTYHPVSPSNPEPYYSGTLEVGEASFIIGNDTLTTRAYRQEGGVYTIPGPTIRMTPGNKYVLRFHNTLPYQPASSAMNVFKDPNVSNVHTHGVHISGESPSDDVTRSFEGGFGGDFVYDIPADHMGGTFWYHAHHHGSTFLQVSGGAFGLMLIDDASDGIPANVAAMTERKLVIAYLDPSAAGTGGDTLMTGTLNPTWTVNGLVQGSFCGPENEWQHWRVLLADRSATEKTLGVGPNCEVALLARDGVWRTTAPKILATNSISLTGASRADLAVRCSNDSTITINGNTVANIYIHGAGNTTVGPYSEGSTGTTWSAIRPPYLRDLRGVPSAQLHVEEVRLGARSVNGSKFNHDVPNLTLAADKVQQWNLAGNNQHPFHLHVYHVQAQDCSGDFEDGEYYDTVSSACSVRFDLNAGTTSAYQGRTIMHCHILEHEDQGAMGWADVVGGLPPPSFPVDNEVAYSEHYALGGTAPVCGDLTCDVGETRCSCASDCGAPPLSELSCGDGVDDDCDNNTDCADADCNGNSACATSCDNDGLCEPGEDCSGCGADCTGVLTGKPANRHCCGDGLVQQAEGNGAICDGNY